LFAPAEMIENYPIDPDFTFLRILPFVMTDRKTESKYGHNACTFWI